MSSILNVEGLEVTYHTQEGDLKALHEVSFQVQAGQIVGVVGESGCGKSTVASALMRLLPPNGEISQGKVLFQGVDLRSLDDEQMRRMRGQDIAMIFQDPMTSLNPVFTIRTQLMDILLAHPKSGVKRQAMLQQALEVLEMVGIPDVEDRMDDYPHQFSGGMRQRIMIAMALMSRPGLLIADEPTSALDVTLEAQILALVKNLRHQIQTSILYITHDLGVVAQLCDQVIVMYAGRIVEMADIQTVFDEPKHPYTQALLASVPSRKRRGELLATIPGRVPGLRELPVGCKFSDRCPFAAEACFLAEPGMIGMQKGERVRCFIYDTSSSYQKPVVTPGDDIHASTATSESLAQSIIERNTTPGKVLLGLNNLSTHFPERRSVVQAVFGKPSKAVRAVDGVNLQVRQGEIIGLVGESGSGKTTLGRTILQLVPMTDGQIIYDGVDITHVSASSFRKLRSRIQMIFQDPVASLSPRMRVNDLLMEPYQTHRIPEEQRYSVGQLLKMVGLSDEQATKFPHELSGGQARRVGIARALALKPEFLVADEPTAGLDVSVASSILNLMKEIAYRLNLTYLIITHNLNIVGYVADRIAVMYLGKLVEVGYTDQIFDRHVHPYTMALMAAISEPDPRAKRNTQKMLLSGEIPSPKNPPPGCTFHPRCPFAESICRDTTTHLVEVEPEHWVGCHLRDQLFQQQIARKESSDFLSPE